MADFDRPLSKRGRRAAPAMARWLAGTGWRTDVVLCSPARRTRETLDLARPFLNPATVVIDRALYLASAQTLARLVGALEETATRAVVVAHNPGLEALAHALDPAEGPDSERLARKFPTAAMARFRSSGTAWSDFAAGPVTLVAFMTPADLEAAREA